jgi:hypothetical protein
VTLDQYVITLRQKTLEKKVDKIKEQKTKEREEKILIWVEHTFTPMEKIVQRNVEKDIELGSTMHGLLQQLGLLVNDSTTNSRQSLGPILWGIKDLA